MSFSRNSVVLLPVPFTDLTSRKVRPAIVVGNYKSDLFLVPITSQMANVDLPLRDWRAAGLNVTCGVKAQLATPEQRPVVKVIGNLSAHDKHQLDNQLRTWLQI